MLFPEMSHRAADEKTCVRDREGVNQPSQIVGINWLTLNFGPIVW